MKVYEAIKEMRKQSKEGTPFSFSYMSYSKTKGKSSGIVEVSQARLRRKSDKQFRDPSNLLENYLDLGTNEPRQFYLPLLMSFNNQKLELS